jgi:hypothetical protein
MHPGSGPSARVRRGRPGRAAGSARATLAGLLGISLAGAPACRGASASSELERQLAEQVTAQLGAGITVGCPAGRPPLRCIATVGRARVPIALTLEGGGSAGTVRWRIDGLVISAAELERQVGEQLAALGLSAEPRCGASLQPVRAGERVRCELPPLGVAWATVAADGGYALELALGAAAAARSSALDEAALDALSRALDREEGTQGAREDDDEGEAESGAGGAPDRDDAGEASRDPAVSASGRAAGGQP